MKQSNKKNKVAPFACFHFFIFLLSLSGTETAVNSSPKKPWTFLVFIAGDNDLSPFVYKNITQMSRIGSNQFINIVVCLIGAQNKHQKLYRIAIIEKNNTSVFFESTNQELLDSGDPESLIFFCKKAIKLFPADNYALILWDHGTGPLDFQKNTLVRTKNIFMPGKETEKRKAPIIGSLLRILVKKNSKKGVCFDDTTGNSLSEKKLIYALDIIVKNFLGGEKFSLIGCDACFMGMIEIASIFKSYADLMIGSEQSEPGAGWNYEKVLAPFLFSSISKEAFGSHIVNSYKKTYSFYNDHTLSCINLSLIQDLEACIKSICQLLQKALEIQINQSVYRTISLSKNRQYCTYFDEPTFIDLYHFYENLLKNLNAFSFQNKHQETILKQALTEALKQALLLIEQAVIKSTSGEKYPNAKGLAVYFPEYRVHELYKKNIFSLTTDWSDFLINYIQHH